MIKKLWTQFRASATVQLSPPFLIILCKIVVFDDIYILIHFHIILKQNGMSSTDIKTKIFISFL